MRRGQFLAAAVAVACAVAVAGPTQATERLELEWNKVDARGIEIYIDTNLPDETVAMLSASRTYTMMEKGKVQTYSHRYFEEKGPLYRFRLMDRVPIDDAKWSRELKADLDKWARLGMPTKVRSISENIDVRIYAYSRENGRNKLLAKSEIAVRMRLSDPGAVLGRTAPVAPQKLEVNRSYRLLGKGTPLMPSLEPRGIDVEAMLKGVRSLPAGTLVTVLTVHTRRGSPWYKVSLPEHGSEEGWINSVALRRDGVRPASQNAAPTGQAAAAGLRAEIWAKVIDPCLARIVRDRGGVRGLTEAQAVQLAKDRGSADWNNTADNLVEAVKGQSEEYKKLFFGLALTQCVDAGK